MTTLTTSDFNDWGLFIILDEEENKQMSYRKLRKNILQIETIEEGDYESETDDTYGGKIEYYKMDIEREYDEYDRKHDDDQDNHEAADMDDIIKKKIQFLITYVLTTSFSIALIMLTFSM
jgi:hypothetical protein